jgi:hypothetical protein
MDKSTLIAKLEQMNNLINECLSSLGDNSDLVDERTTAAVAAHASPDDLDFTIPVRPFMKTFVSLSGAKKFVLLVAWIAKGDLQKQVVLSEVEEHWSGMAGMLGLKFNRKFSSDARESDWVKAEKPGVYTLRPNWKQVLNGK